MAVSSAGVDIDYEVFGESLGGWKKRSKAYAQYEISGTKYRTYRPVTTITPDGGSYVSIRIDHIRGLFSSDDHAMLEVTIDKRGHISSARSSIAIQGQSISSDMIQGVNKAGASVSGIDKAVQIGADLVSDLSAKLLRSRVVEAGRVSYPSAVRHNYNLLHQAIRLNGKVVEPDDSAPRPRKTSSQPETESTALQINGYRPPGSLPMKKK